MIVRSFDNGFNIVDWTQEITQIPNSWGTIGQLGIFSEESVSQHVVTFEEIIMDQTLILDRVRGQRAQQGKDFTRKLHSFSVPHFPIDDYISPQDVQGKRAYGSASEAETLAAVRTRKMMRLRKQHADLLEYARAQVITAGTVYAPNGTIVAQDWNAEFGVTRLAVDFVFGTSTTDVIAKIEQAIAQIQDNTGGETMTGIVCLASPEFFGKLIAHASVKTAYQYYASTQEPLRQRLGGATALHREFDFGGVRFIEMRDVIGGSIGAGTGQRLIPAGDAYFVPTGTEAFKTYFSPANRFDFVNTLGEKVYMFEQESPKGDKIEIETESNFVNALLRPAMVVRAFSSN